jgi:PKD repeat protein
MTDAIAAWPRNPRLGRGSLAGRVRPLRAALAAGLSLALLACQSENDLSPGAGGSQAPTAQFVEDQTAGAPGLEVQFTDQSTGEISEYRWDFGAAGTRSEPSPRVRFDEPGVYTVELTVSGPAGESRMRKTALISVDEVPTAGLDCTPTRGFAPLTVVCSDESTGATSVSWNFGNGVTSSRRNPTHVYTAGGTFTLRQTARSAGGMDSVTTPIEVLPLSIGTSPASGTAPVAVVLTAQTGGVAGIPIWSINGQIIGSAMSELYTFRQPGTYRIGLVFGELANGLVGMTEIDYVVGYGPANADFEPTPAEGSGPMSVVFEDRSGGAISRWNWDFGDGSGCTWPAPTTPGATPTCDAASPRHVYDEIGSYDVRLDVTGPGAVAGAPAVTSTRTRRDAVRVLILDASFERQAANAAIAGAWTPLRPEDELEPATHRALSTATGGRDAGMPSEGSQWAVLDGLGTDGTVAVDEVENGIAQEFLRPVSNTVLEFDYALLFAEPPAGSVMDAVTATVSDGTTTVEIPSARTDVSSAFAGISARYPTRDGSAVRLTPTFTAALDLAAAFPASTPDSRFTLTIRVANATNAFRSPRAYVDQIRFVAPASEPQTAQFALEAGPIVAGQDVVFTDESCLSPGTTGCEAPTSWRWDFGTSRLPTPPSASGSTEPSPTYRFPAPGVYDVRLRVARADQESEATLTLTVVGGPVPAFATVETAPFTAPATLRFEDRSTFDPSDPIVAWSWDFGGWGVSTLQNPAPVVIGQAGDWLIRLRVTTASGQVRLAESVLTVE